MSKEFVWLDNGHGGSDPGACANGFKEKDMTLTIGKACKKRLVEHGVKVGMTREDDRFVSLNDRCVMANRAGATKFVSIHINAGGGDGAEAIHSVHYGKGTELAKEIVASISRNTEQNLRPRPTYSKPSSSNTNRDYFAVIRDTNMSATIIECGFIDNVKDVQVIDTVREQEEMGIAIADGILIHLGITPKDNKPAPPTPPQTDVRYGVVTASQLNIRSGRGTEYNVLTSLSKGTKVKLVYLLNNWWSIDIVINGKPTIAFCSANYIDELENVVHTKEYGYTTATHLNIRSGRGTSYKVITSVPNNTKLELISLKDGWYEVLIGKTRGFCSAKYIRK